MSRRKVTSIILIASLIGLVGCGSSEESAPTQTRTPVTSASQLKVHIDDFAFLLDGLRDLGLDCGEFDQIDAWIKENHEFALCYYKGEEIALNRWYTDADALAEISSGEFQPWCKPYVWSNNWAISIWDAPLIREIAGYLETEAEQFKTPGNAKDCML